MNEAGKDSRLPPAAKVLSVKVGNDVRTYPVTGLKRAAIMNIVAGQNTAVFIASAVPTGAAYHPIVAGKPLTFESHND